MKRSIIVLMLITMASSVGCTTQKPSQTSKDTQTLEVINVSPEKAKEMIEENDNIIVLDVRTEEEFKEGHLEGAILLPDNQISNKAESILPDKDAKIIVYCRSGRRSAGASEALSQLGYSNVFDLGGITSWPYEIVIE